MYIKKIKKERFYFAIFFFLAIAAPICAYNTPLTWLPKEDSLGAWVQRSGSVMAVFGLLAESRAVNSFFILNPNGYTVTGIKEAKEKYGRYPAILNSIAFLLIAIGTFIWGYGDIVFK